LQHTHPASISRYNELTSKARGGGKRRHDSFQQTVAAGECQKQMKQFKQSNIRLALENANMVTQKKIDDLIVDFIVSGMLSLNTVDLPAFRNLITGLQPNRTVMSRLTLRKLLLDSSAELKSKLIAILSNQKFVATTADCWTTYGKAYLGITVHWIDRDSLERKSACLALRRIRGHHTFDIIAKMLEEIHKEFRIEGKIVRTTTDSGSNFVKAFSVFGEKKEEYENNEIDSEEEDVINPDSATDVLSVTDVFSSNMQDDGEYTIPKHQRCGCHSLHLIASKDVDKAEIDAQYKKVSRSSFAKCQGLWNKFGRSAIVVDAVTDLFKLGLKRPNQTRWNSVFFAVQRLLDIISKHGEDKLNTLCTRLDLPKFTRNEIIFLTNYADVMAPVARAIDILQAEKKMFMGYLAPTILRVREQLSAKLESGASSMCKSLAEALISGIDSRFTGIIDDAETVAAAIIHPRFKTIWIGDAAVLDKGLRYIKRRLSSGSSENHTVHTAQETARTRDYIDEDDNDFFHPQQRTVTGADSLEQYLRNSNNKTESIKAYPDLFELFIELNTPLPASAAVERLFSTAGLCLTKRRNRMSDDLFENLVFFKMNKSLV
jgi:KRAB domain-containing zinc finger protein